TRKYSRSRYSQSSFRRSPGQRPGGFITVTICVRWPRSPLEVVFRFGFGKSFCCFSECETSRGRIGREHTDGVERDGGQIGARHPESLGHDVVRHCHNITTAAVSLKNVQHLAHARP